MNIPDEWLSEAGAVDYPFAGECFAFEPDPTYPTLVVAIATVPAPVRAPGVTGLDRERTVAVLRAIVSRQPLPPIRVHHDSGDSGRPLVVRDGFHRYYISRELGFPCIPVSVWPYFDINSL
jgi:hypothetical protein